MGKDKALIEVHGRTILDRTIELLKPYSDEVFVSIRQDQSEELNRSRHPMLIDDMSFKGPMAGIMSASKHNSSTAWIIVSCDLPFLDDETMTQLLEMRAKDKDATVFSNDEKGIEPLCSIYEPSLLQKLQQNSEIIENMSPQLTLKKMNLNIIQPRSLNALYNLNRMTTEISDKLEIE